MSFELEITLPRWARMLGLSMDWQSRPHHKQCTYHSKRRGVEITTGQSAGRLALQLSQWEESTNLHFAVPGFQIFWKVGSGKTPPIGEMGRSWGASTYAGDFILEWGDWSKRWTMNPFAWHGHTRERLRADGEWDSTDHWTPEGEAIEWYSEEHPYAITSLLTYRNSPVREEDPRFEQKRWDAQATCHIERSIRTRKYLPFWKYTQYWVDVRLANEIGPRTGSWKGGTIGFAHEMLPGDRTEDVIQRAAREGRGR